MTKAVTTLPVVAEMLKKSTDRLERAIPKGIPLTVDRLKSIALQQFTRNPMLYECTPESFVSCVLEAAQMGLEFGELKHCALVPYNNDKTGKKECKLMVQYQGWLAMLWRSQSVKQVQAKAVYKGDEFEVEYGTDTRVIHRPKFQSKEPELFYAAAMVPSGEIMVEVMTMDQVEAHAKQYARGLDKASSPWNTSFEAMALKTVLRKLIKLLPLTADSPVLAALRADEEIWEADKETARMEKFREITAAPDVPTEDDKKIALGRYAEAVERAKKQNIGIAGLPMPKEKDNFQTVNAIADAINRRCDDSLKESTNE